jgi:hypothetical protein
MSNISLDFVVVPTYNLSTLMVVDASSYPSPLPSDPTIEVKAPGFDVAIIPFNMNGYNIFTSSNLGITPVGVNDPLPDGIYHIKYSVAPAFENFVEKSIMRVDKLQEKFDEAFMKLDVMQCDGAVRKQAKEELNTIYFFIQASISSANNCAIVESIKLYNQAEKLLNSFIKRDCGCSGNNY